MSVRPPQKFSASADLQLWLLRFELYVREAAIPSGQRVKELLSLLEDEPFRVVSQQGLLESESYDSVKSCLLQRFSPEGNELEWQFHLQNRLQKPNEPLADFAGELRVLVAKAYPEWTEGQRIELARNQFIRGVRSSSVQLQLMKEKPTTLDAALTIARQLEVVEASQKRMHSSGSLAELCSITKDNFEQDAELQTNATLPRRHQGTWTSTQQKHSTSVQELAAQVKQLTEEVASLRQEGRKSEQGTRNSGRRVRCWNCRRLGHVRRDCPDRQQHLNYSRPAGEVNRRPLN